MEALPVIKDSKNCLLPRIILCYSKLANKALQRCLILETHVKFKKTLWTLLKLLLHQYVQFWTQVSSFGHSCLVLDTSVSSGTRVSDFRHECLILDTSVIFWHQCLNQTLSSEIGDWCPNTIFQERLWYWMFKMIKTWILMEFNFFFTFINNQPKWWAIHGSDWLKLTFC